MADDQARAELRRLLDSAVGRLLMEGLSWDGVVAEVGRRLAGGEVEASPVAGVLPEDRPALLTWREGQDYMDREVRGAAQDLADSAGVPQDLVERLAGLPLGDARPVDEPGEPPVGSVVTDMRSRVCWRDPDGWWRSGMHVPITWAQVCQAVGGPEQQPMPGTPTVVSQPPQRAQGRMVVRPAGSLELSVQRAVLGDDGQPLPGPNGQPMLRTETESIAISEVVPADGAR